MPQDARSIALPGMHPATESILVVGIGNPSRGDDALGPLCIERLAALNLPGVALLSDFQLQVEYALDLLGRRQVIFVDAALDSPAPFSFTPAVAAQDASFSSHAMSPAAVLQACWTLYGEQPEAWVLGIRGQDFALGANLSPEAAAHLDAAVAFLGERLPAEINRLLPRSCK